MKAKVKATIAGKVIMIEVVPDMRTIRGKRRARSNPTPEAMKKVNYRNAAKRLAQIICANFGHNDYHLTLSYANEIPPEEAHNNLRKFLRNMRETCARRNITWKWVAITEYKDKRIHHHIVCPNVDMKLIEKRWRFGNVSRVFLDETGDYTKLAKYFVKETEQTFRDPGSSHNQRYSTSRNIVYPKQYSEKIYYNPADYEIKNVPGYYIVKDSVAEYENAYTGAICIEYTMVCLPGAKPITQWPPQRE